MSISTHVLDQVRGAPAVGVQVRLERLDGGTWQSLAEAVTDGDGRARDLLPESMLEPGDYRLRFATAAYFERAGIAAFHPEVTIAFRVRNAQQHYHVPLLLGPWGYTTYRGS